MPNTSTPAEVQSEGDMLGSSGHRVLIFAQLKSYLDIVEADVLAPAGISYLRLDGRCVRGPLLMRLPTAGIPERWKVVSYDLMQSARELGSAVCASVSLPS